MSMTPVGATSRWVAANRAVETESPDPLYRDPYARELAGEAGFEFMRRMTEIGLPRADGKPRTGPDPYLTIRTRFLDDAMVRAVKTSNITQAVILAAGLDARAFRLDWPAGFVCFEVDRTDVFDHKEPVLQRLGAQPKCDRRVVRADLAGEWVPSLEAAGFDRSRPAALLVEGLLPYLEAEDVSRLFKTLRMLAAPGSWIGFDAIGAQALTSPLMKAMLKDLEALGSPFKFGLSNPKEFLAENGWEGTVLSPGEPGANFGRWPYPVPPPSMKDIPRNYLMEARRTNT